jgi:hypothetical protein
MAPADDGAADEARPLENPHVFRRSFEGHVEGRAQLAHSQLTLSEPSEHLPPDFMGERVEDRVHVVLLFNHMVESNG